MTASNVCAGSWRGELYQVRHPAGDPERSDVCIKRARVFIVVSRQALIDSRFSTAELTDYVGALPPAKLAALNRALRIALHL